MQTSNEMTQKELESAFYRAQLHQFGLTLNTALQNRALSIGLNRMAEVAQKPAKPLRWDQTI
jgi:hypothetical protein